MANLIIMCGVPGSGKTTFAKKTFGERDLYISRDEIRFSMIKDNDKYFSKEDKVYNEYIKQINDGLKNNNIRYVIADATHLNYASRKKLLDRIENKELYEIILIFINVSLKTALERNKKRTGRSLVPEDALINMYNSIEIPTNKEKIDKIYVVNEDGNIYKAYGRKGDK